MDVTVGESHPNNNLSFAESVSEALGLAGDVAKACLEKLNALVAGHSSNTTNAVKDLLQGKNEVLGVWALVMAKVLGNIDIFDGVKEAGASIYWSDKEGNNALHLAVLHNNAELLKILLEIEDSMRGEDTSGDRWFDKANKEHMTPMLVAANKGYSSCMHVLVEGAASRTIDNGNENPYHICARKGYAECLKVLGGGEAAELGMKDSWTSENYTPLKLAVEFNHADCVRVLIQAGVRVKQGTGVLHIAAFLNHVEVLKLLLEAGESVDEIYDLYSPLHMAASGYALECVRQLLAAGADVKAKTSCSEELTALHMALEAGPLRKERFKYDWYVENLDGFNEILYNFNGSKQTHVVRELLAAGAEVGACRPGGDTPLHFSATDGHWDCMTLLLEAGADVNAKNTWDQTPLICAAEGENPVSMVLLIEAGANLHQVDDKGRTALHIVCKRRSLECIEMLIKEGMDVNAKSHQRETPLELLVRKVKPFLKYFDAEALDHVRQCVEVLWKANADTSGVDLSFLKRKKRLRRTPFLFL